MCKYGVDTGVLEIVRLVNASGQQPRLSHCTAQCYVTDVEKFDHTFFGFHRITSASPYCCANCARRRRSRTLCLVKGETFSSPRRAGCANDAVSFSANAGMRRSANEHCRSTIRLPVRYTSASSVPRSPISCPIQPVRDNFPRAQPISRTYPKTPTDHSTPSVHDRNSYASRPTT